MARSFLGRLHDATIRVQVPLVLSAVPVVAGLYGVALVPVAVDVALDDAPRQAIEAARTAMAVVVALLVACVALATAGAALLLRGSLRSSVEPLHAATGAIAGGDFRHRISSARDDELGELAGAIDTMAERLERLEHARRRLLACVSHELRTPLTIIQGHAFTLGRSERDPVRGERLELIQAEVRRLASLIEDLVEASSLHAGSLRLDRERVDLRDVARAAAERFRAEAGARDITVRCHLDRRRMVVDADSGRLEQVLANLLANAVRHATPGTSVDLLARGGQRAGSLHELAVRNVGPAIRAEDARRIFEPFVQAGGAPGRLGLGLTVAQGIVAAHGGELSLRQGAAGDGRSVVTFSIGLPAVARRRVRPEQASSVVRRRPGAPLHHFGGRLLADQAAGQ